MTVDSLLPVMHLAAMLIGMGAVYGGIRADLRRLHVQAEVLAQDIKRTRKKLSGHIKREDRLFSDLSALSRAELAMVGRRSSDKVRRADDQPGGVI